MLGLLGLCAQDEEEYARPSHAPACTYYINSLQGAAAAILIGRLLYQFRIAFHRIAVSLMLAASTAPTRSLRRDLRLYLEHQ